MISVLYHDLHTIRIEATEDHEHETLAEYFSYEAPNRWFIPAVKKKRWDGIFRLYNPQRPYMLIGLIGEVRNAAKQYNIPLTIDPQIIKAKQVFPEELLKNPDAINEFVQSLNLSVETNPTDPDRQPIALRDHQRDLLHAMIQWPNMTFVSATGSGKSLSIYTGMRLYHDLMFQPTDQMLLVVPNLGLVHQLYADFEDYAALDDQFDVSEMVQKVHGSAESRTFDKPILIANWQAIVKMPAEAFANIKALMVDECHTAKTQSIQTICKKCANTFITYGFTGTLQDTKAHKFVIQGSLGPAKIIASVQQLVKKDILSPVHIKVQFLNYSDEDKKAYRKIIREIQKEQRILIDSKKKNNATEKYQAELEFTLTHPSRTQHIIQTALEQPHNTLVLFQRIEMHGARLFEEMQKAAKGTGRKVFFIYGEVEGEIRQQITKIVESETNAIIMASYKTYSVGINLKNLHTIIFASSTKSKITLGQSIGRGMRLHETKDRAVVYDIVDNLNTTGADLNYAMKHYEERMEWYIRQGYTYETEVLNIQGLDPHQRKRLTYGHGPDRPDPN